MTESSGMEFQREREKGGNFFERERERNYVEKELQKIV